MVKGRAFIMNRNQYAIVLLFSISLLTVALTPLSGQQGSTYDPWLDYNNDGTIDAQDLQAFGHIYGTSGTPLNMPMSLKYDSDWLNITDKQGKYIFINHNLNLGTQNFVVSIWGKTTVDGAAHQRQLDTTGYTPGWNRKYEGLIEARSLIKTDDGGYALAGSQISPQGDYDIWLVKTDVAGFVQWSKTYGGPADETAFSVVQTNDGGYAIAGGNGTIRSNHEFLLVKVDSSGNHQWNNTYAPAASGAGPQYIAYSLVQTVDGGYALAGFGFTRGSIEDGTNNFYLVKTDSSGIMQWEEIYGLNTLEEAAYSLVQTSDQGYAIAGLSAYGGGRDSWLVKTDSSGTMQWNKTYERADYGETFSVVQTSDGGYALGGGSSYIGGYYCFWLTKTDSEGIVQWDQIYGCAGDSESYSLVQTEDGGYAMAGYISPDGSSYSDFWLVETDSSGNRMWDKEYGASDRDSWAYSLVQTSDHGYALAGYSGNDAWLIKTDAYGQMGFSEIGLSVASYTADAMALYRGRFDPLWNYVRVRIWVAKTNP
jgi:hypothetical protein